jgi:hypothetical protein
MGRLTLNILLSFAQFEREVTGERIRDKIAASKRKGMWMGGTGTSILVNDFVRRIVRRVVVHSDRIEIEVGKQELLAVFAAGSHASLLRPATPQPRRDVSDVIRFKIEARIKRCGGEIRLVLHTDSQARSQPQLRPY